MTRYGKPPILVLLLALAACAAALFGALVNQLVYAVGPSHFEAHLFPASGIEPGTAPRFAAARLGAQSGWWAGPLIALPAFLYGLVSVPRGETYLAAGIGATGLVFALATFASLLGLLAGIAAEASGLVDPLVAIPDGPVRSEFLRAAFMHDAIRVAAGLGILLSFWPMIRARRIDEARLSRGDAA
jgi:hypothetical protein